MKGIGKLLVKDLKEQLTNRNVEFNSKLKKAELRALLETSLTEDGLDVTIVDFDDPETLAPKDGDKSNTSLQELFAENYGVKTEPVDSEVVKILDEGPVDLTSDTENNDGSNENNDKKDDKMDDLTDKEDGLSGQTDNFSINIGDIGDKMDEVTDKKSNNTDKIDQEITDEPLDKQSEEKSETKTRNASSDISNVDVTDSKNDVNNGEQSEKKERVQDDEEQKAVEDSEKNNSLEQSKSESDDSEEDQSPIIPRKMPKKIRTFDEPTDIEVAPPLDLSIFESLEKTEEVKKMKDINEKKVRKRDWTELPTGRGIQSFRQKKIRKLNKTNATAKSFRDQMMSRHQRVSSQTAKMNRTKMKYSI